MFAHRGKKENRLSLALLSGLFFGAAVLTRDSAVFFFFPTLLYLLASGRLRGQAWRSAGACLAGALPFLLAVGWYNALRSGSPFLGGYEATGHFQQFDTPILRGLAGLLISPGKGLLEYNPLLLLLLIFPSCMLAFRRRTEGLSALFAITGLMYLFFYSRFRYWDGGLCWGPRYLLPVIPLLLLPLGEILERPLRPAARIILWLLVAISVMIQLSSVLVDHQIWFNEVAARNQRGEHIAINSSPLNSPLLRQWQSLGRVFGLAEGQGPTVPVRPQEEFNRGIDFWWVSWPLAVSATLLAALAMILAWRLANLDANRKD